MKFPKIIVSSVKRCAKSRETHGHLYIVDLANSSYQRISELKSVINDEGRGGARGYRGIAIDRKTGRIFVAKDQSILVMDKNFNCIHEIFSPALGSVHELSIYGDTLYCASTAFDSIVAIDLIKYAFKYGICIRQQKAILFSEDNEQPRRDNNHINNVHCCNSGLYICGTQMDQVWRYYNGAFTPYGKVPRGTHNAHPFNSEHILCNDTAHGRILLLNRYGKVMKSAGVTIMRRDALENYVVDKIARQPFARGLTYNHEILIGGSSPDMISVYDINTFRLIKEINMSFDITNAIHGIKIL